MKRGAELLDRAKEALVSAGLEEAELHIHATRRGCARFSISELSQHMALDNVEARVRVAHGRRVAEVATTDLDALAEALAKASDLARRSPEVVGFAGFAPEGEPTPAVSRFDQETAGASDEARTAMVEGVLTRITREGLVAAGMLETSTRSVAVATTRGCARAHDGTRAELRVWALTDAAGKGASGHGSHLVRALGALAVERATEDAIRAAKDGRDPGRVDAGTWDVVMEPVAVAELLEWLGTIAFGAPELEQGTSALAGRLGARVTGEGVSITEAPLAPDGLAEPFDREGTPRRDVSLIEHGIARGVLYDRVHAARAKADTTGSALAPSFGAPGGVGAVAMSVEGGSAESVADLVSGVQRGLYIRRLHYVNGLLDTRRAVMTGLSRDGCFLVEHGKVSRAVGNVRLTDSFLEMLGRADGMTRARETIGASWTEGGAMLVPAIRFRSVRLTSGSR
jgi:PmbA protein